jgi:hypothetical protein
MNLEARNPGKQGGLWRRVAGCWRERRRKAEMNLEGGKRKEKGSALRGFIVIFIFIIR